MNYSYYVLKREIIKKHLLFPLYLMAGALLCDSFSLEHIDKYNFIEMTEYWE